MLVKVKLEPQNIPSLVNKCTYSCIDLSQLYNSRIKFHNDKIYALSYSYYI